MQQEKMARGDSWWTQKRRQVFSVFESMGVEDGYRQARKLYASQTVEDVKKAWQEGDRPPEGEASPGGEAILSMTFKTRKLALNPIIATRYDAFRQRLSYAKTIEEFIDECTEVVVWLAGVLPSGFYYEKEDEVAGEREERSCNQAWPGPAGEDH